MSNKYTFNEVMELADLDPKREVWCISTDGTVDCIMTTSDIKKSVINREGADWRDVNFMKINENEVQDEPKDNASINEGIAIAGTKIKHRIQMFRANNLADLMTMVNQFLEDKENVIKIDYQIGQSNTIGLLSMEYSVMVHYIESQV